MAITYQGKHVKMSAVNDVLPGVKRVNKIHMIQGTTGATLCTLREGGATGDIISSGNTINNNVVSIQFSKPQDIKNLTVTAMPASNFTLLIFLE